MLRTLKILFVIILISGCSDKDKVPANVLQPEQFADVLMDVHLAEADLIEQKLSADSSRMYIAEKYRVIFSIHDITEEEFIKSFSYYRSHPKKFFNIYEKVVQGLIEKEEQQVHKEMPVLEQGM